MKTIKFIGWLKKNYRATIIGVLTLIILGQLSNLSRLNNELKTAQNSNTEPETIIKEVEKIVEVEKTPQACKDLVEIDNAIFAKLGTYFEKVSAGASTGDIFEFIDVSASAMEELNGYIDTKSATRNELAINCNK